ncbi:hypothetical protein [Pantoea agglomerans]|uniref:hypothetical protein n=1 Tax=Enterobacter agglomerans TaxID=549 RepID=UPI003C7D5819
MKKINSTRKLVLVALMGTLLTGCDSDSRKDEFFKVKDSALLSKDPFAVMNKYYSSGYTFSGECEGIFYFDEDCKKIEGINAEVMTAAINKGSTSALLYLFTGDKLGAWITGRDLPSDVINKAVNQLLKLADETPPVRARSDVFLVAGDQLQSGYYVSQNTSAAIAMYLKAWRAGDSRAAERLAQTYKFLNDDHRVYFWQIRARNVPAGNTDLDGVSGQEKLAIQQKAADLSIINL